MNLGSRQRNTITGPGAKGSCQRYIHSRGPKLKDVGYGYCTNIILTDPGGFIWQKKIPGTSRSFKNLTVVQFAYSHKKQQESWSRLDFLFENGCVLHLLNDSRICCFLVNLSLPFFWLVLLFGVLCPVLCSSKIKKIFLYLRQNTLALPGW